MILLGLVLLAAVAMAPLAFSLTGSARLRGHRESALAVHRAQLAELDRDFADGRIPASEHASAVLEVQRRLLAAADAQEPEPRQASPWLLAATLVLVPLAGVGLYVIHGQPNLPAEPLAARLDAAREQTGQADAEALIAQLRAKLANMDPKSDMGRQGYVLLGNSEASLGHLAEAADAWKIALDTKFDPTLAAQTAEAQTRVDGKVTPETAALFKQALAAAPPDAPWRSLVQNRLANAPN